MRTVIFDFETFYSKEFSLRKKNEDGVTMSYQEYILDERFAVHVLGIDVDGQQLMVAEADIPETLKEYEDDLIVFHNAFFDAAILAWKYNWRPKFMIDTLALANHVMGTAKETGAGNDLDSLAERLDMDVQKKDLSFMLGVRYPSPGQLAMLQEYLFTDLTMGRKILDKLLPRVTNQDMELWLQQHTIRMYTDRRLQVDMAMVEKTRQLINVRRKERVAASGVDNTVLSSNAQFAAELKTRLGKYNVKLPMKLSAPSKKDGARKMIPALAKGDPGFQKLIEHKIPQISDLVRGRLVERSAVVALARLKTLQRFADVGIPVHLVYYGAHTGRFAGGGGFNFQNLTSSDRAIDAVDREIAASIRAAVVAGAGNVFVAVDAAQIEGRVLPWLAGDEKSLAEFASGIDRYSAFISGVLGEDIHKPVGDEPADVKQHLKLMRQVGKEAVLGLGFNMGVDKFYATLKAGGQIKSPDLAKFVDGGGITIPMVAKMVKTFRESYPDIPAFWAELNAAFMAAFYGKEQTVGYLHFSRPEPGVVTMTLPNGRAMYYRDLRTEKREGTTKFTGLDGKLKTMKHEGRELRYGNGHKIYGGLLAENATQAVARDILVEQGIYAAENAGYPVVLTIHDEVVCRVPEVQGPVVLDFLIKSLSTAPEWGAGLILGAEGRISKHLGKE